MGTKNALTEKVYSGKDIMRIAYPILISLLMEQMFWFRYRSPDSDCPS